MTESQIKQPGMALFDGMWLGLWPLLPLALAAPPNSPEDSHSRIDLEGFAQSDFLLLQRPPSSRGGELAQS